MNRNAIFVSTLLLGLACAPEGEPTLDVTPSPITFGPQVTQLRVRVVATDSKGLIGSGTVSANVSVGTLDAASATLDAYGTATFRWDCVDPDCVSGGNFEAQWAGPMGTAPVSAIKLVPWVDVGQVGATGGGTLGTSGGSGGGGLGMQEIKTDSSWRIIGTTPASGWNTSGTFSEVGWSAAQVIAPEGNGALARQIWDGPTSSSGSTRIYVRKKFSVLGTTILSATMDAACNDDMDIWINGVQVVDDNDRATTRRTGISVQNVLKLGENLIAASCEDVVLPEHSFWLRLSFHSQ